MRPARVPLLFPTRPALGVLLHARIEMAAATHAIEEPGSPALPGSRLGQPEPYRAGRCRHSSGGGNRCAAAAAGRTPSPSPRTRRGATPIRSRRGTRAGPRAAARGSPSTRRRRRDRRASSPGVTEARDSPTRAPPPRPARRNSARGPSRGRRPRTLPPQGSSLKPGETGRVKQLIAVHAQGPCRRAGVTLDRPV